MTEPAQVVVVMFCGPHDDGMDHPLRRILEAIGQVRESEDAIPLVIVGGSHSRSDTRFFARMARHKGVADVVELIDHSVGELTTLTDVRFAVSEMMKIPLTRRLRQARLVTDDWHMPTARAMLQGELDRHFCGRSVSVSQVLVNTGPRPHRDVFFRLNKELNAYRGVRTLSQALASPFPNRRPS
jgi:hypothetical protein